MIRVLQVIYNMDACGGIQSFIMNVYRQIDRSKVQFDFLLCEQTNSHYEDEINRLGGKLYFIPGRKKGIIANKVKLNSFFKTNKYDVVHFHSDSLSNIEPLVAAKNNGVKTRIMHCHNTGIDGRFKDLYTLLHKLNKKRINRIATHYFACSKESKKWAYGNSKAEHYSQVINNCINIKDYMRSNNDSEKNRKEFGIPIDAFVLGYIGRIVKLKNPFFTLEVFCNVLKRNSNSILVLVGDGPLMNELKKKIEEMKIQKNVLLLGAINDTSKIYKVLDCFILPSKLEGFPMSMLEAQASGASCIVSDTISKEAILNKNVIQMSINDKAENWAKKILDNIGSIDSKNLTISTEFDAKTVAKQLLKIYLG